MSNFAKSNKPNNYMNLEGKLSYDRQYLPEKILSVRILDSLIFVGYAPDIH
jgi:hypothetical protein